MKIINTHIFRIVFLYIFIGCSWIFFSDLLLGRLESAYSFSFSFQTLKGLFFIFITSVFLFLMIRNNNRMLLKKHRQLINNKRKYKILFDYNPVPLLVLDEENLKFLAVNRSAVEAFGYSRQEFLSKRFVDLLPPSDQPLFIEQSKQGLKMSFSGIWCHVKKNKQLMHMELRSYAFKFYKRRARIVLALDVSSRRRVEEEVVAIINELDHFVYRASHDLRGPLATLKGLAELALLEVSEVKSREYFKLISKKSDNLDRILARLLSINNIKNTIPEIEDVNVHQMIDEIMRLYNENIDTYGIRFINELPSPYILRTDKRILRLILQNLLENSIKFRRIDFNGCESYIKVASTNKDEITRLRISDNGIKIPESEFRNIFHMFYRASERSDGSGLGLYIARIAAEKLKGSVELSHQSEREKTFEVKLPLKVIVKEKLLSPVEKQL